MVQLNHCMNISQFGNIFIDGKLDTTMSQLIFHLNFYKLRREKNEKLKKQNKNKNNNNNNNNNSNSNSRKKYSHAGGSKSPNRNNNKKRMIIRSTKLIISMKILKIGLKIM